jgi:hypothetical protein
VSTSTVADEESRVWRDHTSLFETVVARQLAVEPGQDDPARDGGLRRARGPSSSTASSNGA